MTDTINSPSLATRNIEGIRAFADFLEANPKLAEHVSPQNFLAYLGANADPRATLAEFARAGLAQHLTVDKDFDGTYGRVLLHFGPITLQAYSVRDLVCERIVTGTREVTTEVPDPEALAAVPTITRTEVVEDVRWECTPLLAPAPVSA